MRKRLAGFTMATELKICRAATARDADERKRKQQQKVMPGAAEEPAANNASVGMAPAEVTGVHRRDVRV